jgi:hypothetical protein
MNSSEGFLPIAHSESSGSINDDEAEACTYNYSFFHFIYMSGAMYITMLLTQWNSLEYFENPGGNVIQINMSWPSVWIKVVSSWLAYLFYIWTMVAPLIFPDREFGA